MIDEPTDALAALEERIARLEAAADASQVAGQASARAAFPFDLGDGPDAVVAYSGRSARDAEPLAWQMRRTWEDVIDGAGEGTASVLSALASGPRLRIVAELARGPVSTGDLAERLDQPSTGQLFHHLKELLAASVVHQPQRGVYAIRKQHLVPVLVILSAAADLTTHTDKEPQ